MLGVNTFGGIYFGGSVLMVGGFVFPIGKHGFIEFPDAGETELVNHGVANSPKQGRVFVNARGVISRGFRGRIQ
jgi:hypothetical protein